MFREILLSSEDDLKDFDEPIAFAVFGRGRAMPALVGKGINNAMIDDACTFLSGPCSCQVKRQNPGFDILTSVNWDELLEAQIERLDDKALAQAGKPAPIETTVAAKNEPSPSSESPVSPVKTPSNESEENNEEAGEHLHPSWVGSSGGRQLFLEREFWCSCLAARKREVHLSFSSIVTIK